MPFSTRTQVLTPFRYATCRNSVHKLGSSEMLVFALRSLTDRLPIVLALFSIRHDHRSKRPLVLRGNLTA